MEVQDGDAETAAITWLVKRHSGEMTPQEERDLAGWLAGSPDNARLLADVERLWVDLGPALAAYGAAAVSRQRAPRPASRSRWRPFPVRRPHRRVAVRWALAASLARVVVPAGVDWSRNRHDYVTDTGHRRLVALPDGSRVRMAPGTAIDREPGGRGVTLVRGEAYFEVAHDGGRPFAIRVGDTRITDIGTAFGVTRDGDVAEVTVVEGAVEVAEHGARGVLGPGDAVRVQGNWSNAVVPVDADQRLAWRRGKLILNDEPLVAVLAMIQRYTGHRILLLDPDASAERVSAVVMLDDVDAWLDSMARTHALRIVRLPGVTVLS